MYFGEVFVRYAVVCFRRFWGVMYPIKMCIKAAVKSSYVVTCLILFVRGRYLSAVTIDFAAVNFSVGVQDSAPQSALSTLVQDASHTPPKAF